VKIGEERSKSNKSKLKHEWTTESLGTALNALRFSIVDNLIEKAFVEIPIGVDYKGL